MIQKIPLYAWVMILTFGLHLQAATEGHKDVLMGAHYLLELQGASTADPVWPFNVGDKGSSDNYGGIVAQALIEAYTLTQKDYLRISALAYADYLEKKERTKGAEAKVYHSNIEFLMRLSEAIGQKKYAALGHRLFEAQLKKFKSAKDHIDEIVSGRGNIPSLTGFDAAVVIRAAFKVGNNQRARALAKAALKHHTTWNVATGKERYYATISKGAMLEALAFVGGFDKDCRRLARSLTSEQDKNGAWLTNETQATAYAIRGLAAFGAKKVASSLERGVGWLLKSRLSTGAWPVYNDQVADVFAGSKNSEVHSEALLALIRGEKALGKS
jgi:hypothetical protein